MEMQLNTALRFHLTKLWSSSGRQIAKAGVGVGKELLPAALIAGRISASLLEISLGLFKKNLEIKLPDLQLSAV